MLEIWKSIIIIETLKTCTSCLFHFGLLPTWGGGAWNCLYVNTVVIKTWLLPQSFYIVYSYTALILYQAITDQNYMFFILFEPSLFLIFGIYLHSYSFSLLIIQSYGYLKKKHDFWLIGKNKRFDFRSCISKKEERKKICYSIGIYLP